jgi:hypothetical protein
LATKQADSRELIEGPENSGDFAATVKAKDLRDSREYDLLDQFVEELRERGVTDPQLFKLQAQSLIERGKPATPLVRLEAIATRISSSKPMVHVLQLVAEKETGDWTINPGASIDFGPAQAT